MTDNQNTDNQNTDNQNTDNQNTEDNKLRINIKYDRSQSLTVQCLMAFASSFSLSSGLPAMLQEQKPLNGFTGRAFRHMLNNICKMKDCTYLEVGTFCGSSLVSSLYGNYGSVKKAYAVDNWSEFREYCDPAEKFNIARESFIPEYSDKLKVIEADCFSLDLSEIDEKIDIYFYDGAHTYDDHKKAFTYFNDVLQDTFIAIVDDWEKSKVRDATYDAFKELGYKVLAHWEVMPPARDKPMESPDMNWWHGISLFVIKK
jgi:hypothetical protein